MTLSYQTTTADVGAWYRWLHKQNPRSRIPLGFMIFLALLVGFAAPQMRMTKTEISISVLLLMAVVFAASLFVQLRAASKMALHGKHGVLYGPRTLHVTDNSLVESSSGVELRVDLNKIARVELTKDHVFLLLDPVVAVVVPRSAFSSADAAEEFANNIRHRANSTVS